MDHSPTKALKKYQYRRIAPLLIIVAEAADQVTSMEKRHPSTSSGQVEHGAEGWRSASLEVGGIRQRSEIGGQRSEDRGKI